MRPIRKGCGLVKYFTKKEGERLKVENFRGSERRETEIEKGY